MTGAPHRTACAGEPDGLPVESAAGSACGFGHGKGTASTLKLYRVRSGHMAHEAGQTIRRAWLPSFPLKSYFIDDFSVAIRISFK